MADQVDKRALRTSRIIKVWTRVDAFHTTFHVGNTGSNPVWDANNLKRPKSGKPLRFLLLLLREVSD
jgi:hypothetical protein